MKEVEGNNDLARHNSGAISNTNENAFALAKKAKMNAERRDQRIDTLEEKVSRIEDKIDTLIKLCEVINK